METIFIKLGGSLITNKDQPMTPRLSIIRELCQEIKQLTNEHPDTRFILGHGSGSFGHAVAKKFKTRIGVYNRDDWEGFLKVWWAARSLNQIVMNELTEAGILAMAFPPSATCVGNTEKSNQCYTDALQCALQANFVPVVFGDVVFDQKLNGTIYSTEDIFILLAEKISPTKILLAGIEESIWEDFPNNQKQIPLITPQNYPVIKNKIGQSASIDVTGGMIEKVKTMLDLLETQPKLKICIFSGQKFGNLTQVFNELPIGTWIKQE
jgi:isopentenyl phosphate kinase